MIPIEFKTLQTNQQSTINLTTINVVKIKNRITIVELINIVVKIHILHQILNTKGQMSA